MKQLNYIISLYAKAFSNLDRNVWILAIAMFVNRTGSMVLLFASLFLTNEQGFTLGQAGVAMSFYGFGSILGSFTGGYLADRKNYFDVMVGSLIISGMILPLILLADSLFAVSAVIFIYAFASDMFRPAMSKGIAFYSTPENRTRSVSLIRLAINLGFSFGPMIGGVIAFYIGYKPLMIIDGLTSILAGLVVIRYLPRKVAGIKPSTKSSRALTKPVFKDFEYLFFILMVALYGTCFFQLFASVPQYLDKVWDYNEIEIAWILALNGFLVVVIEMPLMTFLENKRKIFHFILTGALCVPAAFFILISGYGMIGIVILYTLVITFSEILAMPFMMNFTLSRPAAERQGEYSALYSIAFGIANTCAPLVGLGIADLYNFDVMFYLLITLGMINALGFWFLKVRLEPQRDQEEILDSGEIN